MPGRFPTFCPAVRPSETSSEDLTHKAVAVAVAQGRVVRRPLPFGPAFSPRKLSIWKAIVLGFSFTLALAGGVSRLFAVC